VLFVNHAPYRRRPTNLRLWVSALKYALPITALVLGWFYHWFAIADRYIVFLYNHDMGPRVPDTSPFSVVTSSRYWMAGLVASGAILVLHTTVTWLLGRLVPGYRAPSRRRVWLLCALPLALAIPLITLTVNQPTLRLVDAVRTTLATLVGLALAFWPGKWAAERPAELLLMSIDGLGIMLWLSSTLAFEHLRYWLASGGIRWVHMSVAVACAGLAVLMVMTVVWLAWSLTRPVTRPHLRFPGWPTTLCAGVIVHGLLMPLFHHLFFSDGYYYISDSDNFFARNPLRQGVACLTAAALAFAVTRLRQRLAARATRRTRTASRPTEARTA
jgi:hypothetical protein